MTATMTTTSVGQEQTPENLSAREIYEELKANDPVYHAINKLSRDKSSTCDMCEAQRRRFKDDWNPEMENTQLTFHALFRHEELEVAP